MLSPSQLEIPAYTDQHAGHLGTSANATAHAVLLLGAQLGRSAAAGTADSTLQHDSTMSELMRVVARVH